MLRIVVVVVVVVVVVRFFVLYIRGKIVFVMHRRNFVCDGGDIYHHF